MKRYVSLQVVLAFALLPLVLLAQDQVPQVVSYQGYLTDSEGSPVQDGIYTIVFSIWDDPTGGEELWSETHTDVQVTDGLFSVLLGIPNGLPPGVFSESSGEVSESSGRYLQVEVGVDGPISPRTRMVSVPYSLVAHRLNGDVITLDGKVLVHSNSEMLSGYGISIMADADSALIGLESSDGSTRTLALDKATPQLYRAVKMKKSILGDSSRVETLVEADIAGYSLSWWGHDMASPDYADSVQAFMRGGPLGAIMGQHMYSDSDTLEVVISSTALPVEEVSFTMSAGGTDHTEEISFSAIPVEQVSLNMSHNGGGHMEEILLDILPMEEVSFTMSTEGTDHTEEISFSAIPVEQVSLNMSHNGGGHTEEISLDILPMEEVGFRMSHGGDALPVEEISLNAGPVEEVSFRMMHGGEGLPVEEISFSTGPGGAPVGMQMYNTPTLLPRENPSDTNVQLYATTEGGYMAISNVGGTEGDGYEWDCNATQNTMRLRHGGYPGVYMEANSFTGGSIGINTESPSEALQVLGSICATGSIGVCSDIRFKENVHTISEPLEKIASLRGVNFTWKSSQFPEYQFREGVQIGFIAQEVVDVLPGVVSCGSDGFYSVDYGKLTPLLVEAVKEQQAIIDNQMERIDNLQQQLTELSSLVETVFAQQESE